MNYVRLTDDELAVLDGRCSEQVQAEVDRAKGRLAAVADAPDHPKLAAFVADAVSEATENGRLIFQHTYLNHCRVCGRSAEYPVLKSGPRKGQPNFKRDRLSFRGVELARRFVTVKGTAKLGACKACMDDAVPLLVEALRNVQAEVPATLTAEGRPAWSWHERRECSACGWEGHDGQMVKHRTVLGDGWYPAECPSCGAVNRPFGASIVKPAPGFEVVTETWERET